MKMYKISTIERNLLLTMKMSDREKYNPVQDKFGDWFISEVEYLECKMGTETLFVPEEVEPLFK